MGALISIRVISSFGTGRRASCYQLPVKGSTIIYQGATVGKDANGFAVPMNGADNTLTAYGVARHTQDNSAGADGGKEITVDPGVFPMFGTGLGYADLGKKAYATSDQDFSTSSNSGARPFLGIIEFVNSATEARLSIQPPDGGADALEADLADTDAGLGASKIGINDAGSLITATTVEAALQELAEFEQDLGETSNGNGASMIGIEDSATIITATTVEGALAELAQFKADLGNVANGKGASKIAIEDAAGNTATVNVEAALAELYGFNKVKIQKIEGALGAGSLTVAAGIVVTANTRVVSVNPTVRGGTFPAGGFQSLTAGNTIGGAGTGAVTITARKSDGTLENGCTDTVCALLIG